MVEQRSSNFGAKGRPLNAGTLFRRGGVSSQISEKLRLGNDGGLYQRHRSSLSEKGESGGNPGENSAFVCRNWEKVGSNEVYLAGGEDDQWVELKGLGCGARGGKGIGIVQASTDPKKQPKDGTISQHYQRGGRSLDRHGRGMPWHSLGIYQKGEYLGSLLYLKKF